MSDFPLMLAFAALLVAIGPWAFCFIGKKSAKNQLAGLHARIAQLEATVGGQAAADSTPTPPPPSENPQ
ncbi:MAG TPA: hypothetical protein EYN03_00540 [Planctomycetes bacterium]|jgi:hypothetical protein|nr:hypothetical protein [Planctomycetaceae bacterium]HIN94105.1 hypothetical protein [Planctomycetota bacterium]